MLRLLATRYDAFNAKGKVICIGCFCFGCCLGLVLPFVSHMTFGRLFLPVDESLWGTEQEKLIVRNVFVCCGFASVVISLVGAIILVRSKRLSASCVGLALVGSAMGALTTMIYFSPGGWLFITR